MTKAAIEVLGVYRLDVTDELFHEQLSILYPADLSESDRVEAEHQIREQLESTVLIEVKVHNRDRSFDSGDFAQPRENEPPENWQVAWAETYLSSDGESLAVQRWKPAPETGDLRVAFFIHYWDTERPLRSSYGDIHCPLPQPMPERLSTLVPYETVD